jgi:putative chitinase
MISAKELSDIAACSLSRANAFINAINRTMDKYLINTQLRQAHFLAQILHESGRLVYVHEIASGVAYEGRKDLGNTQAGDGVKYKGRGLIQITGRANYQTISNDFGIDFITHPEFLETAENAALSAGWFWDKHGLNTLADSDLLVKITRVINGGQNGIDDRRALLVKAKKVLGI